MVGGGGGERIHAFGDHAQNTGIYSCIASLYNILRKDVEQDTLSQASMPLAPHSQNTGICSVFAFLYNKLCKKRFLL